VNGSRKVALVAGATRGAGRALAVELARAGFYVYATGRSSRASGASEMGRPETIEETGELIAAAGGQGSTLVCDHEDPASVAELVGGIDGDRGRLDVLVNDIFGGDRYMEWDKPVKASVERIVKGLAVELENEPVAVVGVTPGWLRSEGMLENFGVSEANWRDACRDRPGFAISESPTYVARGVAALALAGDAGRWKGSIVSARQLADAYGWERDDGHGIDEFR
jgi:NAD(P)-dependent dehydrogenase (short-subunit alcohol dehydrogenase family)